jgi:hypothetical protein
MRDAAILSGVAAIGVAAGWVFARWRRKPDELERRRRALVQASGRFIEGSCTDVQGGVVYYEYRWRGVEYAATQDLSSTPNVLPHPPESIVGPITVKFLAREPSNSIVFSEEWSGFLRQSGASPSD